MRPPLHPRALEDKVLLAEQERGLLPLLDAQAQHRASPGQAARVLPRIERPLLDSPVRADPLAERIE